MRRILIVCALFAVTARLVAQPATGKADSLLVLLKKSKPDTNRIACLNALGDVFLFKKDATATDKDSAFFYANAAQTLSRQLHYAKGCGDSFMTLSRFWRDKKDTARGKENVYKAISMFKSDSLLTDLGYALYELSGYYSLSGYDLSERICIVEMATAAFHRAGNLMKEADALKELADVRQIQGNFQQALKELKLALQLKQTLKIKDLAGMYNLLGDVCTSLGNLDDAVKYCLLAIQVAEAGRDTGIEVCSIYNHLGIAYYYQGDFESATTALQKAVNIAEKNHSPDDVDFVSITLSNILIKQGRFTESNNLLQSVIKKHPERNLNVKIAMTNSFILNYTSLGQLEKATPFYIELLELTKNKILVNDIQRGVHNAIINYLLSAKEYKKVRPYLVAQEKYLKDNSTLILLAKNQLWWFKLDSAEGNLASAITHYKQYKLLNDSVYNQTKSKQISQLKIQYETDQKDKDILLKEKNIELLTKQGELQHTQLREANILKNVTLAGIVLLIIFFSILYNNYRLKTNNNRRLEVQQKLINEKNASLEKLVTEKDWLVKEIHHRVKNNFHIVMGLLGTQSGYLKNEEAIAAMTESQQRIQAMSLIHQKLYQSENLSAINMPAYIHELVEYLKDCFDTHQQILFNIQVERIDLDVAHSLPIGLILNEAITNAIKYAFPGHSEGIITIDLKYTSATNLLLTIRDNGAGLPKDFNYQQRSSMGMNLMQGLSEDIGGDFSIVSCNGTIISIAFAYKAEITSASLTAATNQNITV